MPEPASNLATAPRTYSQLRSSVEAVLVTGQQDIEMAKVRTYWDTGRLINEHVLLNGERAELGAETMFRLAEDLNVLPGDRHAGGQGREALRGGESGAGEGDRDHDDKTGQIRSLSGGCFRGNGIRRSDFPEQRPARKRPRGAQGQLRATGLGGRWGECAAVKHVLAYTALPITPPTSFVPAAENHKDTETQRGEAATK